MGDPYRDHPGEPRYRVVIDGRAYHVEKWRYAIRAMRSHGVSQDAIIAASQTVTMNGWTGVSLDVALDRHDRDVMWVVRPLPRFLPKSIGSSFGFRFRRRRLARLRAAIDRAVCP